jgi:hypothetical protein
MNIPLEPPSDQSDPLHEPGGAAADSAQRGPFEFMSAPLSEELLDWHGEIRHDKPTRNDVPQEEPAPSDEAAAPRGHTMGTAMAPLDEVSKANLRRLEETVSWLQSEAGRLPPAAPLPPVPGLPAQVPFIDQTTPDRTLQRSPTIPITQRQPPPLRERGVFWPRAIKFAMACGIAAPLSYYFAVLTSPLHKQPAEGTELASLETPAASPPPAQRPSEVRDGSHIAMAGPESAPPQQGAPSALRRSPLATTGLAEAKARSSPPMAEQVLVPATKMANLQDVRPLIDRGKQFFEAGDLTAARIVFLRAVIAGEAEAAVAMGATYDPIVLGDRGGDADLDKARKWYERAKEMGSAEGPRRLEMLANR